MSYNVLWDTIFPEMNPIQAAKFARVVNALNPDVLNLQEIDSPFDTTTTFTAADVANLMNSIMPLPGGSLWQTYKAADNVIVSKYPLTLKRNSPDPTPNWAVAMSLVNLPDAQYNTDFYFMNNHFKCCGNPEGPEEVQRQRTADAIANWMRDARTAGGSVNLPAGTPMAVVGDLNIVGPQTLDTLITGNIMDEATFGTDSPPDWDGTDLGDAHPLHNVAGPADYTWRDETITTYTSRIDFVLFTDSVARIAHKFVLNTVDMSPAELTATGLETYDIVKHKEPLFPLTYDHLPLVVDFRFPADYKPGDYDLDRVVDPQDQGLWQQTYGATSSLDADGSRNTVVDTADYVVWRKFIGTDYAAFGSNGSPIPEPASNLLLCVSVTIAGPRLLRTYSRERN
jgi:endonuclease/exonuclease/phosphatase family metal-dependent hydrolase